MHVALEVSGGARRLWSLPLSVDALLHYCMLGSCYGCFLGCLATLWIATTDFPGRERVFQFHRASPVETDAAHSAHVDSVIELNADGSLSLDGRSMGDKGDRQLQTLTGALLLRQERHGAAAPVVIRAAPLATHGRIVDVLNALTRAGSPGYVLLFAEAPADEMPWRN